MRPSIDGFASSHPRAPDIYASLVGGTSIFIDFLLKTGALSSEKAVMLSDSVESGLKQAFSEQGVYLTEQDECERFVNLLRGLLISGNAHIACRLNQGAPNTRPHAWGWRVHTVNGIDATHEESAQPMGDLIGWYYDDDKNPELWLTQDVVFAKVQQFARNQGDPFLMGAPTLWRRMLDRGLITKTATRANGQKQSTTQQRIGGVRHSVMVLSANVIAPVE